MSLTSFESGSTGTTDSSTSKTVSTGACIDIGIGDEVEGLLELQRTVWLTWCLTPINSLSGLLAQWKAPSFGMLALFWVVL